MQVKKLIGIAAVAMLTACGGGTSNQPQVSNQIQHSDGPDWKNRGSGAFGGDKGRVFYGVGIASGIRNYAMRRSTADSRARSEIASQLDSYVSRLNKMASTGGGDMKASSDDQRVEQALKTYSQMELSAVLIVDHYVDNEGSEWALAQLDMDTFKSNMDKVKELNEQQKQQVRANADKAFDELNAEEAKRQK
jgi:hypothetical protein